MCDGGDGGGGGSGAVEPEQSTMYVLQDKLRVLTLYNIYSRLGKTESLGPWRKVIVHHSKPSLCQNDSPMHSEDHFGIMKASYDAP